jgi:hypothetical protein
MPMREKGILAIGRSHFQETPQHSDEVMGLHGLAHYALCTVSELFDLQVLRVLAHNQ